MSLLTLLFGDRVEPAPGTKIIKAADVSKLVEAEQIIDQIRSEEERLRKENEEKSANIRKEAHAQGIQEGQNQWAEQLALLEEERLKVRGEMRAQLTKLALLAAKKIVGREIELNEETVADIIVTSLRSVSQDKRVTIYCNRADIEALEKYREKLQSVFERLESLSIQVRDDVEEKGCIIETERGIIDAQVETLWQTLEEAFARLADRL